MSSSRILYVDDEVDLLELATSFFEDENLYLETCSDFTRALELIRQNKYDLIISDAKMPAGSGQDIIRVARQEERFKGKIILVTGNLEGPAADIECDLILYKPINFPQLIETIKNLLKV